MFDMTEQNEKPTISLKYDSYLGHWFSIGVLEIIGSDGTTIEVIKVEEYESLKQENEKLREALSFYADFNNWFGEFKNKGNMNFPNIDKSDWEQFQSTVGGKRARHALAENKGNE